MGRAVPFVSAVGSRISQLWKFISITVLLLVGLVCAGEGLCLAVFHGVRSHMSQVARKALRWAYLVIKNEWVHQKQFLPTCYIEGENRWCDPILRLTQLPADQHTATSTHKTVSK